MKALCKFSSGRFSAGTSSVTFTVKLPETDFFPKNVQGMKHCLISTEHVVINIIKQLLTRIL